MRRKLIIEQVAKKCNIPKKIKLLGFMKKVTDVIIIQIDIKTLRRFRNFFYICHKIKIPKDMPEIIIKLAPTH